MWHDVPNRGSPFTIGVAERNFGDIGLASAWQGDNAALNAGNGTAIRPHMPVAVGATGCRRRLHATPTAEWSRAMFFVTSSTARAGLLSR